MSLELPLFTSLGLAERQAWRPYLMGIVNATPDSFSDQQGEKSVEDLAARAADLIADGADIIDVGGESGITNKPAVDVQVEIDRVVPVIESIARLGAVVSVDTYKPEVARAAITAGALIVNDVSGLADDDLAAAAAEGNAALVLMHTRANPKTKLFPHYDDVGADVANFLSGAIARATAQGLPLERIIIDPGPDFAKTPAQTIEVLRQIRDLKTKLGRPVLLAASRKDFVGALTNRGPRERDAGTLAAIGAGVESGVDILRVHDVAGTNDFLTVRAALSGQYVVDPELALAEEKRRMEVSE
jgi:dihydropteroate synthase